MLNLTDFMGLLMLLAGPFSGVAAAHQHKAGIPVHVLFGLIGLAIGFGVAMMSSKLAYSVLRSKKLPSGLRMTIYSFVPMLSLFLVLLLPALLAMMIYGQR